jgi:hypothetical protein
MTDLTAEQRENFEWRAKWALIGINKGVAEGMIDALFDNAIMALRRDPRMPRLSYDDWSLILADVAARAREDFADTLLEQEREAWRAVRDALDEDEEDA